MKQSTNGLGAHWAMMAARDQWGSEGERGIYWDIMDTGDEGGRVRRARVEECSCRSYPCVTLKPNTYLLSCKMAVCLATPDGDSRAAYTDLFSQCHTWPMLS